jgi:hypothetical protein
MEKSKRHETQKKFQNCKKKIQKQFCTQSELANQCYKLPWRKWLMMLDVEYWGWKIVTNYPRSL